MGKVFLLLLCFVCPAFGASASGLVSAGNALYGAADFDGAIGAYDKAVEIDPEAFEAKFNKGASLFRKGEVNKAIELFQDVAAGSGDKELVGKAKYNLGNSYFRRALEQKEPDAKKAMADYKASVNNWRQVLDMDKSNASAGRNVEIAKAAIQKLKEDEQKQKQQQGEDGEEGDEDKEKQKQDQEKQGGGKDKEKQEQQGQEKQEGDKDKEKQEQQDQQEQEQEGAEEKDERQKAMDALAEDILKKEKEDRKKRQMLLLRREPVEKDW